MSVLSIIFMVGCYPIIFLMYFMFRNMRNKNGYCFGATLSKELKNDPAIDAIDMEYRKRLKRDFIILGIIPFVALFIPYISIEFTIWMIWILVICFYPMVLYAKANAQVQELKRERGWEQASEISYTDLKIASIPRKVKFLTFFPTLLLSVVPVVVSYVLFPDEGFVAIRICMITFAACTWMFYGFAVLTDKQKMAVICDDSDTNMNFARAKKQIWKNFWLTCAWINTGFIWFVLVGMYFRHQAMAIIIWGCVAYGIVVMLIALKLVKKINELNRKYESKRTVVDSATDDSHWYYGMMYYNPKDTHVMVENRMGTGTAMNMATGVGKGMYIVAFLCLLIIPVTSIWMIMLDFTPMKTEVVDDTIVCTHLSVEYEIPLEEIESYKVITEMPEVTKVAGNGMDDICSGTFEIYREGMFEAFYNPQNDLFIKIITEEETYYISGIDDAQTQKIIEKLEK
ncbi:MAG: hypothetical protein IJE49_03670 [Agathobacter sp.]|nr:hypothetical protein [Agathobacter sp.]